MLDEWGASKAQIEWLVKSGLWAYIDDEDDSYPWVTDGKVRFQKWDEYQPTKAKKEHAREKNREKLRHWRGRKGVTGDDVTGLQEGLQDGPNHARNPAPVPSRPDPLKDSMSGPTVRPDVEELCSLLADLIAANGSKRPTVTQQWRDEARRMLDIDKRELDKVRNLIRWSQADGFWRKNILSMPKFRQRYDQLRLAALEEWEKNKTGTASPDGEIDVDAILGRDVDGIGTPPEDLWGDDEAEQAWRTKRRAERKAERLEEAQRLLARRQGVLA